MISKHLLTVLLLMTMATPAAHAQVANNNEPWEMFMHRLVAFLKAGDTNGVQIVNVPYYATWNEPTTGKYQEWHVVSDRIPQWGLAYTPSPRLLTDQYGLFIKSIVLPVADPAKAKQAEAARKKWLKASEDLEKAWSGIGLKWADYERNQLSLPPHKRKSYDQWFAQFEGPRIATLQTAAQGAALNYVSFVAKAYKGYQFAADFITNFDNPAYQVEAKSPDGLVLPYRTYNITPDLTQWIADSKTLVAAKAKPVMKWEFTKSSGRRQTSIETMGGGFSWGGFLWGVNASGGYSRHSVDASSSSFYLLFEARNLAQFTITPGRWFSGAAVTLFKNGPFEPGSPATKQVLFGEKGAFSMMPTTLVVAFQPKIVARLTASEYHFLREHWQGGGGFSIGPFSFGASASRTNESVSFDDATNTVTAENTSDVPQVIAVVSSLLPDFK